MRSILLAGAVLGTVLLPPGAATPARAHGTGEHVLGTIEGIEGSTWKIRTRDGDVVTVTVGAETRMETVSGKPLSAPPKPGDRVAIDVSGGGSELRATRVRAASAHPPALPGKAHSGHEHGSHGGHGGSGAHAH